MFQWRSATGARSRLQGRANATVGTCTCTYYRYQGTSIYLLLGTEPMKFQGHSPSTFMSSYCSDRDTTHDNHQLLLVGLG